MDTTPFVDKYFLSPGHHTYDWRGVLPRNEYLAKLLKVTHDNLHCSKNNNNNNKVSVM